MFDSPTSIDITSNGNLVVADRSNYVIRSIVVNTSQAGTVVTVGDVTTLAGSTLRGYQDGQGTFAIFSRPLYLRVGPRDEIVITDEFNCLVRVIEGYPMPTECE